MSRVGLVLGGGGITGASYEMAALMALELATGWDANEASVVVGTSAGAFVGALVRAECLSIESLVGPTDSRADVADRVRRHLFQRKAIDGVGRWMRHGILPGLRKPGVTMLLGSPGRYDPRGVGDWLREQVGEHADRWPTLPTIAVAYDVAGRRRVPFGTDDAPDVTLFEAVAASSAVPVIFSPLIIEGRPYVDGGVVSGTHADLVLGNPEPLDLVLVLAPMAAEEDRVGAWFHERMFDRVGRSALDEEVRLIREAWPDVDILVLRPPPAVLSAMRPNPMDADAAVPSFIRSLTSFKKTLAHPDVWHLLHRHLHTDQVEASA